MQEDEDMLPPSPFWLQSSSGTSPRRRRSSSGSVFFSSGAFVVLLVAIAAVFLFCVIPSVLSFTTQMFRPHLVKKSWDSLNLVLVLFAIVCGFLSRNSGSEEYQSHVNASQEEEVVVQKSNPSTPRQWYEYNSLNSDRTVSMSRMRNSSSYPDLRQESQWVSSRDERWRFYDDTHVSNYRVSGLGSGSGSDQLHHHRRSYSWQEEPVRQPAQDEEVDHVPTKNIPVDTFVIRTEHVSYSPPPPISQPDPPPPQSLSPPPLPPPRKAKRTYQALGDNEKSIITQNVERNDNLEVEKKILPPPPRPPPPPPPLPPPPPGEVEHKRGKNVKKRGVATTKEFLITSLRRKKKKQRQKSVENFETLLESSPSSMPLHPPPSPPPPPPPPPQPPSVFHNLFSSKKTKPKKTHYSVSQPSPPPPVTALSYTSTTHLSKTKAQTRPMVTTQKPPLPVKVKSLGDDENAYSGSESPMMTRIPPPPPPPPFRMPKLKFAVVQGDFVRLKSNSSDDGGEDSPTSETSSPSSESPTRAMFCPSPDVNTKADTFIARFRAGLRLEKMNSVKEGRGMSNLGPGPDTREDGVGPG